MSATFTFYSDPSHGWLKVPMALVHKLGITRQISAYSYQRGQYAYLEEDCDYSLFKRAHERQIGEFKVRERAASVRQSRIRTYPRFTGAIDSGAPIVTSKRLVERRPGYDCVYYLLYVGSNLVEEVGPYKWNKPSSPYYCEQDRREALQGAKSEAKAVKRRLEQQMATSGWEGANNG